MAKAKKGKKGKKKESGKRKSASTPKGKKGKKERKDRGNPAMEKALKIADKKWPAAKEAPIVGFEEFPVGTYVGKTSVEIRPGKGKGKSAYVRWGHTVVRGDMTGKTCYSNRFLTGRDEEATLNNLKRLAGEIEAHGYPNPKSLAEELPELVAKINEDARLVKFKVDRTKSQETGREYTNVYILTQVDEDDLPPEEEEDEEEEEEEEEEGEGEGEEEEDEEEEDEEEEDEDEEKPSCFGEWEDIKDCHKCGDEKKCKAETGDEEEEDEDEDEDEDEEEEEEEAEKPKCFGEWEDVGDCRGCEDEKGCKAKTEGGEEDEEEEEEEEESLPDEAELLALCEEWEIKVPKKARKSADKLMAFISEKCQFPKKKLSEDELNLLERFPEEHPVKFVK